MNHQISFQNSLRASYREKDKICVRSQIQIWRIKPQLDKAVLDKEEWAYEVLIRLNLNNSDLFSYWEEKIQKDYFRLAQGRTLVMGACWLLPLNSRPVRNPSIARWPWQQAETPRPKLRARVTPLPRAQGQSWQGATQWYLVHCGKNRLPSTSQYSVTRLAKADLPCPGNIIKSSIIIQLGTSENTRKQEEQRRHSPDTHQREAHADTQLNPPASALCTCISYCLQQPTWTRLLRGMKPHSSEELGCTFFSLLLRMLYN